MRQKKYYPVLSFMMIVMTLAVSLAKDVHLALEHDHSQSLLCDAGGNERHYHATEHKFRDCTFLHFNFLFKEVEIAHFGTSALKELHVDPSYKHNAFITSNLYKHIFLRGPPVL